VELFKDCVVLDGWMAERRQAEAARIREKYPDRIPVCLFLTHYCVFMCVRTACPLV